MITVLLDNRTEEALPEEEYISCATYVLQQASLQRDVELALSLVSAQEMQDLNHQYRGIDEPTDVLSFPCDGFDEMPLSASQNGQSLSAYQDGQAFSASQDGIIVLGDVVIAPSVAREHALEFESTFDDEMSLMIIHGILHLLGYDHEDDEAYELMIKEENRLHSAWAEYASDTKHKTRPSDDQLDNHPGQGEPRKP